MDLRCCSDAPLPSGSSSWRRIFCPTTHSTAFRAQAVVSTEQILALASDIQRVLRPGDFWRQARRPSLGERHFTHYPGFDADARRDPGVALRG